MTHIHASATKAVAILVLAALACPGCGTVVRYASSFAQDGDKNYGLCVYIGGAGPIGHVGSLDVPLGLRDAGYRGYVRVFTWQSITAVIDQTDLAGTNRLKGLDLASLIRDYQAKYPGREVNIIALSAGTGIATFALEYLPETAAVRNVVFLGCSLSSRYDMTRALKRVREGLYVVYSPTDHVLRNLVPVTGSVDRSSAEEGLAGLSGFITPENALSDTKRQYRKLHNVAYREEFAATGYDGGHIDSTSRGFIREYIAGAISGTDERLLHRLYSSRSAR